MVNDSIVGGAVFTVLGTGLFIYGLRNYSKVRLIQNTPTSKIRSLAMGRVEVNGNIRPYNNQVFKSPFTQTDCYYCSWKIEKYHQGTKNRSGHWRTIKSGKLGDYFYVEDDTGKVLVDGRLAEIDIGTDYQSQSFSPQIKSFLEKENININSLFGVSLTIGSMSLAGRYRFTESCLEPDNILYVNGIAQKNPFVQSSTVNSETIMIGGVPYTNAKTGEVLFDNISKEWFYISDKSEKNVLRKLLWLNVLWLILGGGAILLGVYIFLVYFGVF